MNIEKLTESVCPVCYRKVPASIYCRPDNTVWMAKECPEHGVFHAMVERDYSWWKLCKEKGDKTIYDGLLVDVTKRCNLKCKYCFHPCDGVDRDPKLIFEEVYDFGTSLAILTGGEPTLHPDLPRIIADLKTICPDVMVLTNGIKLQDMEYTFSLMKAGLLVGDRFDIGLSYHKECAEVFHTVMGYMVNRRIVVRNALFTIDDVDQLETEVVPIYSKYRRNIQEVRVHAATNLWNEQGAVRKIFVSDMMKKLATLGVCDFAPGEMQKTSYAPVELTVFDPEEGVLNLKLVSWFDRFNIDLWDIDCPPYYKTTNGGRHYNFATACVYSEKYKRDNGLNIRRGVVADLPKLGEMWKEIVAEEHLEGANPDVAEWIRQTARLLELPNYHLFVAELCGSLVGFLDGTINIDPSRGCKVMMGRHVYIDPEYRAEGRVLAALHREGVNFSRRVGVEYFRRYVHKKDIDKHDLKKKKVVGVILQQKI